MRIYEMSKDRNVYQNMATSMFPTIHGNWERQIHTLYMIIYILHTLYMINIITCDVCIMRR